MRSLNTTNSPQIPSSPSSRTVRRHKPHWNQRNNINHPSNKVRKKTINYRKTIETLFSLLTSLNKASTHLVKNDVFSEYSNRTLKGILFNRLYKASFRLKQTVYQKSLLHHVQLQTKHLRYFQCKG